MISMVFLLLLWLPIPSFAQEEFSFFELQLGMSYEDTESTFIDQPDFILERDPLSRQLFIGDTNSISALGGDDHLSRIIVSFYQDQSYQITIFFNEERFSFYDLSQSLKEKYEDPEDSTRYRLTWVQEDIDQSLTLEYPATVKVVRNSVFQEVLQNQAEIDTITEQDSQEIRARQRFLEEL